MSRRAIHLSLATSSLLVFLVICPAQSLKLPARQPAAIGASKLARRIEQLPAAEREALLAEEILRGNVPDFLRAFAPVYLTNTVAGRTNIATIFIAPDYLAVGNDEDFLRIPLTPANVQRIADATGCLLPTRRMVDAIYAAAPVKLPPQPLKPDATMTTFPVFVQHNSIIQTQLIGGLKSHPPSTLVAGHKKDVVITPRLASATDKVAIYGWHRTNGAAIQPLYLGHTAAWVDYSHGARLVSQTMLLNGRPTNVASIFADAELCFLLSDEGVLNHPRYPTGAATSITATNKIPRWPKGFTEDKQTGELTRELHLDKGVRVLINIPATNSFSPDKPVQLIFFALPNGNTIEQTVGKKLRPGDDWHFDIQHIGAQTRFLRGVLTNQTIVVAYLENSLKSWPAWRRTNGNAQIPTLLDAVRDVFADYRPEITLTGHSGGGSLTFGYLNAMEKIPADIKHIAFLDSNYAYETTNHFAKLASWLKASDENRLCVLAYHDSIALLDGKTFVSERGGTWGRSHAMLEDLRREWTFTSSTNQAGLQTHSAANGRIQFLLKENPGKKILHTFQVERNGFIHSLLIGTPLENHGYEYLEQRAYESWVQP
jgi:hypothetical protein